MTKLIGDFCNNHLHNYDMIEEGIKQLAEIGVDYIKFQTFKADNLNKNYPNYNKMYETYKKMELTTDDHLFILDKCKGYGIKPLFTAFDIDAAKLLNDIGVREVKIASPDATNWELIDYCTDVFDNVIISTGMIAAHEYIYLKRNYKEYASFLYCVSKYPTKFEEIDFDRMILFDGFSDHTETIDASIKAINLGVEYVERHFTLGKFLPGKDHKIASTSDEFKKLVDERNYIQACKNYKKRWVK